MKTYNSCYKCFKRQAEELCKRAHLKEHDVQKVMYGLEHLTSAFPSSRLPVEMAVQIHDLVKEVSGNPDPYYDIKQQMNQTCRSMIPEIKQLVESSKSPIETALKLAIGGNIIDVGGAGSKYLEDIQVKKFIYTILKNDTCGNSVKEFVGRLNDAHSILYMGDNTGECFFDSLLLDYLPTHKITYGVRGGPILNDATLSDAVEAGIQDKCTVIDTGDNIPGVILSRCSNEFKKVYMDCDLIISKGQGNYESFADISAKAVIFLTMVKCDIIASDIGYPLNSAVIKIQERLEQRIKQVQYVDSI